VIDICDCDIFLDGKSDAAFLVEATESFSIFILSILGASTAYIRDAQHFVTLSRPFVAPTAPKLSCCHRRKSLQQPPPSTAALSTLPSFAAR
jgi:hypothetical protein